MLLMLLIALIATSLSSTLTVVDAAQGYRKCIQTKDEFMSHTHTGGDINDDPANHLLCECRGTSDDGDYMLLCSLFDTWDYCAPTFDNTEPVCASILFGQTFNDDGQVVDRFRSYDYIDDRMGTITVQRFSATNECIVTVDGDQCKECEIVDTCPVNSQLDQALYEAELPSSEELGIFTDIKVDCTNVNAGAIFECGIADGAGNLLNILNGYPVTPDDYPTRPPQQTIDPNAFPPTITPVTLPTAAPTVPDVVVDDEETDALSMSSSSMAPSVSSPPSMIPSMVPSISMAPSVSNPPSEEPTITAAPTVTAEPTSVESMEPTEAKITVAAENTRGVVDSSADSSAATAYYAQQQQQSTTTTVILFFFSSIVAPFLLTFAQ